jgi:outer membrane protein assembly factor BamB
MPKPAVVRTIAAGLIVVAGALLAWRLTMMGRGTASGPVVPLAAKAAQLAWRFRTGGGVQCAPVVNGGRVYIGSADGNLYVLNVADGREAWCYKTEGAIDGAPLLAEGRVYFGSADFNLYCLDANGGQLLWKYATEGKIVCSPLLLPTEKPGTAPSSRGENRGLSPVSPRVVVGSYDNFLHCMDARDGNGFWKYQSEYYINGSPVLAGGRIVFGGCDKYLHVVSLDGKRIGLVDLESYVIATVAPRDGLGYVGQQKGVMFCIDLDTRDIRWRAQQSDAAIYSTAAVDDKRVIYGSQDGNIYCLDRAGGKLLWNFPTGDMANGSPVIVGGLVLVGGSDGRFYALRVEDGKESWSYATGDSVQGRAAVAGDLVIFGCDDGYVYAVKRPPAGGGTAP